jgi:hypothetical protein
MAAIGTNSAIPRANSISTRRTRTEHVHVAATGSLADALTLITKGHVSDEVYEEAKQRFSDEELVNLQTGGRQQASFCAKSR